MSIALVTGCSTGIGFATAVALARAGHQVFASMRNPSRSPELAQLAATEKLSVTVVPLDVDSDESVRSGVQQILAAGRGIDVLVNNAGIAGRGPVEEADISHFRQTMETNFFGALRCTQAVLPAMREKKSGHILNISSVAGRMALSPQAPYAASKFALEAMSEPSSTPKRQVSRASPTPSGRRRAGFYSKKSPPRRPVMWSAPFGISAGARRI